MKVKDFLLLKKLMSMTVSDADGEALMAVRQANRLLKDAGLDWDKVFGKCVTVINEIEPAPADNLPGHAVRDPEAERIDEAFETIDSADDVRGNYSGFIESLREQWRLKRFLTDKQKSALFNAANPRR